MHELGIMTGVIEAAEKAARDSGATRLLKVNLSIGEMTEAIEDALVFAWEALTEDDPYAKGAELAINMIKPKSRCLECDGFATELLCGRELQIDSIEVDLPDDEEGDSHED